MRMGSANIRWFEEGQTNGCETEDDDAARTRGRKIPSDFIIAVLSGGERLEFSGFVFGEIGGSGAVEALVAVDGGVDLVIRKYKAVLRWGVFQTPHFTEFEQAGSFLHFGGALRFAGGLEGLQHGEVLLDAAVDALLVEREELELLRLHREDSRGGQGGVDLFVVRAEFAAVLVETEGEEVVFDGANSVETPAI